ncbi:ABC transporter permease [Pseudonocardia spinosispora]|uniref:ABC transporter permease n=1 Tax=Pseudonocardia spinosispora TaxID=103441 RepID=UPI00041E91C0|nr:ABC transporter permease [Pseudonocardia spinosispora]
MTATIQPLSLLRQVGLHTGRQRTRLLADRAALVGVVLAPILYFVGFYVPLQGAMRAQGLDYAQYIGPALVAQSCIFTAMASASAMAEDSKAGLLRRVASMPVSRWGPLLGRLVVDVGCGLVGAVAAVAIAALVGFRFATLTGVLGFALVVALFTAALCLLFVAVALRAKDPAGAAEALLVPQLVMIMVSTAFIPADGFPGWLRPVVTWQPVSVVLDALRGFCTGAPSATALMATAGWCVLLGGLGVLSCARAPRGVA